MKRSTVLLLALSGSILGLAASQAAGDGVPAPAASSALARQLKSGETTYFLSCAMCHGDRLEGVSAPALSGRGFRASNSGAAYTQLATFIGERMPDDQPGDLDEQEVLDVTAYILGENRASLPETGLTRENLTEPMRFPQETP